MLKLGRVLAVLAVFFALMANAIAGMRGGHIGPGRLAGNAHGGQFGGRQFHGDGRFGGMHHRHHAYGRAAIFVGLPLYWSGTSYPVMPSYRPPQPRTYMSQDGSTPTWYFCDDPRGYYPDVPACPGGWRMIENGTPVQP